MLDGHGVAWAYHAATGERIAQLQKRRRSDPGRPRRRPAGRRRRRAAPLARTSGAASVHAGRPVILLAAGPDARDTARLDPERLLGFCTARAARPSHTAIIARALGCRRWWRAGRGVLERPTARPAILDGVARAAVPRPAERGRCSRPASARRELERAARGRAAQRATSRRPPRRPPRRDRRQRQPRRPRRWPRARGRRRGRRPDAHRVPVPRARQRARRGRAVRGLPRHGRAR